MSEYLAILALSLTGSAHCIGMCGGLAAALGACDQPLGPVVARQAVYSLGRVCTYAFLGALAGATGLALARFKLPWIDVTVPQVFSLLAGVIMVGVGLNVLGLWPKRRRANRNRPSLIAPMFNHFLNARSPWGAFTAGLATGFLPCGFVYAFVPLALASGDVLHGMLIMATFGLGTTPAMMAVGCGSRLLSHSMRGHVFRISAGLLVCMGAVTLWRGWPTRSEPCCHGGETPPAEATSSPHLNESHQ
jgi:hypothetical protein